jgi:hypothetical protein
MRLFVFAVLAPPLGLLLFLALVASNAYFRHGQAPGAGDLLQTFLALLPFSYLPGFIPGLIAAIMDHVLLRFRILMRPFFLFFCAYPLAYLPFLIVPPPRSQIFVADHFLLIWGLLGSIPAVACSLLADLLIRQRKRLSKAST